MSSEGGFSPLLAVLARLEGVDARLGGGWGIDVLAGRVTRAHHDIDLFVPELSVPAAVGRFTADGWSVVLDDRPCRTVLASGVGGRIDLGGVRYRPDGHGVQIGGEGDLELFPTWAWTERSADGHRVICLTAEAQRSKHRGYPERPEDGKDLAAIAHIDEPPCFDPGVWVLPPGEEEELIGGIETASDLLVEPFGLWPLPAMDDATRAEEAARTAATLVVGRPPVGFCRLEIVDGHTHIGQLSVLPEYGRRGLGRSLIESACRWARGRGDDLITLTTFAHIPFNGPFYRRVGFADVTGPTGPELADLVAHEADLARLGPRVTMARTLG